MTQPFTYSARDDFYGDCSARWEPFAGERISEYGFESRETLALEMSKAVGDLCELIRTEKLTGNPIDTLTNLARLCYQMAELLEREQEDEE